jgi:hypothetical protein
MLGGVGDVPLPRRLCRANGVRFHPALRGGVRITELIVQTAVHGDDGGPARQLAGFDFSATGRGRRHVEPDLDGEQAWARRKISRERMPCQCNARLLRERVDLANALANRLCELVARGPELYDEGGLRRQLAALDR